MNLITRKKIKQKRKKMKKSMLNQSYSTVIHLLFNLLILIFANRRNKKLTFKNNAQFRSCISKIKNTFTDNAEDLDSVMPMYNFLQYSNNYFMTSGSLQNYYRGEVNDAANEIIANYRANNNNKTTNIFFEYKTK